MGAASRTDRVNPIWRFGFWVLGLYYRSRRRARNPEFSLSPCDCLFGFDSVQADYAGSQGAGHLGEGDVLEGFHDGAVDHLEVAPGGAEEL